MIATTSATSIPLPLQVVLVVLVAAGMLVAMGVVIWFVWHPHEVGAGLSASAAGGLLRRLLLGVILPVFPLLYGINSFGHGAILWWDWRMRGLHPYTGSSAAALATVFIGGALLLFFHFFCSPIRGLESLAALGKMGSLLAMVGGIVAFLILEAVLIY